jgi:hypothetical protein
MVHCNWEVILDTRDAVHTETRRIKSGEPYDMMEHSAVLFCEVEQKGPE